jgi:hypothetical protein
MATKKGGKKAAKKDAAKDTNLVAMDSVVKHKYKLDLATSGEILKLCADGFESSTS